VYWFVDGACLQTLANNNVVDSGQATIPAGTLKKPPPPGPDEEHHLIPPDVCTATLNVIKSRDGHLDPAFSGGSFEASLARSASFTSVP
jgi:hypothetical protein